MQDLENSRHVTDGVSYIGIDVSKSCLDIFVHPAAQAYHVNNDAAAHKQLAGKLKRLGQVFVVLEATGKYHRAVHRALAAHNIAVALINPYRSRSFSQSLGQLAKTDHIDARMLALYGAMLSPEATLPVDKALEDLKELVVARRQSVADRTGVSNQLGECQSIFVKTRLKARLKQLERHIADYDKQIRLVIKQDPAMKRRFEIITSVPGLGPVNAITMIAEMPELGSCNDKQVAALTGVAPMARDSGTFKGKRRIRGGRKPVRDALYMAAVTAVRSSSAMKTFYNRLIDNGKPYKVAITAIMRKLVILVNALINKNRLWQPIAP